VRVRDCMTADPMTVAPSVSLEDAMEIMQMRRIRHLPVVEDGHLVGFLSDRDLKRAAPSVVDPSLTSERYAEVVTTVRVDRLMMRHPVTVAPDMPLGDAVQIFIDKKFGALPVVEGERLVGILSQIDVLRAFRRTLGGAG